MQITKTNENQQNKMDTLDLVETSTGLEWRDGYGQLHNPNGPALISPGSSEFFEHGIWQKTILADGQIFQVPTNTSMFEDAYGTRHYFADNQHHGSPSIETLSGTKYYHYHGTLVAQLMPDDSLYYNFDDKLNPNRYTDKTGTVWARNNKAWEKQKQFLPGKRVSITATQKYIEEKWEDPFGSHYVFINGILKEQNCADGTVFLFPYETIGDRRIIHGSYCNYMSTRVRFDENNNRWESMDNITTKITTTDGKTITTTCSLITNISEIIMNGTLRSGTIFRKDQSIQEDLRGMRNSVDKAYIPNPVNQILDQIKSFIPIDLEDQQRWIAEMRPIFEEYQRKEKIRQIIDGKMQDAEFLPFASKLDLDTYQQVLTGDFYNSFKKALRVGQALRLFKLDRARIDSFANQIGKTKAELFIYCCQTLFDNNPDHIKLLGEVNWML